MWLTDTWAGSQMRAELADTMASISPSSLQPSKQEAKIARLNTEGTAGNSTETDR